MWRPNPILITFRFFILEQRQQSAEKEKKEKEKRVKRGSFIQQLPATEASSTVGSG